MVAERNEQFSALVLGGWFERLPEGRLSAKVHLAQRHKYFADGIVPRESIVVKDVQMQHTALQLLNGESLEIEGLVPTWIQRAPLNFCLQPVLLVRQ